MEHNNNIKQNIITPPRPITYYNNDCSVSGYLDNLNKIKKNTIIEKPITTGSSIGDFIAGKAPFVGKPVTNYNRGSHMGAMLFRFLEAYNQSCKK